MKATGIIRRIDDLGRIVVPKEIRRKLGIGEGDPLEIFWDNESVIFRKYNYYSPVHDALKTLKHTVESMDSSELSCRVEFSQTINELEARLKLEEEKRHE